MSEGPSHANRGRGIITWVLVTGAILIVVLVVVVGLVASNPTVRKYVSFASRSHDLAKAGETAPGAAEVKAAGHCQVATVEDLDEAAKLGEEMEDGGTKHVKLTGNVVVCVVGAMAAEPNCDELANAYVDAVHPTAHFYVGVKKLGASDMACNEGYEASGNRISKSVK